MVLNIQLTTETYLRCEQYEPKIVRLSVMQHKKDSSVFKQLDSIEIPTSQCQHLKKFLEEATKQ